MNQELHEQLVDMLSLDERVRSELVASGELHNGYHPRMAAVHRQNARALTEVVDRWGWPGKSLVGERGAEAAWLVLQHSIGHPELMRRCLPLLQAAAAAGDARPFQAACLEDRICCFEGRPQRFGTQFDWDENGEKIPMPLQDADRVDEYRESVGLEPLADKIRQIRSDTAAEGGRPPADIEQWRQLKSEWAKSVGWL